MVSGDSSAVTLTPLEGVASSSYSPLSLRKVCSTERGSLKDIHSELESLRTCSPYVKTTSLEDKVCVGVEDEESSGESGGEQEDFSDQEDFAEREDGCEGGEESKQDLSKDDEGEGKLKFPLKKSALEDGESLHLPLTASSSKPLQFPLTLKQSTSALPREPVPMTDSSDPDVVFLYEELPEPEKVAMAKKFMLPRSFYLYEKKPACPGCRGCDDSFVEKTESVTTKPASIQTPPSAAAVIKHDTEKKSTGFSSRGMLSFSDIVSQPSAVFSKTPGFSFQGAGSQLFSSAETVQEEDPEKEASIDFKPIVTLPESVSMKSWDDNADVLFVHRSKLFRFDGGQWKERGVGDVKILKHKETGRARVLMRRDQILKICCNHYITEDMKLIPGSNEKSWVWCTPSDYSDEQPKEEKMAVRFKNVEIAKEFKTIFDDCVKQAKTTEVSKEVSKEVVPTSTDTWECGVCMLVNSLSVDACPACNTSKH